MHEIEPYYQWRHLYIAAEDERSPFYGRSYSEFEFTHAVYNYLIHPQWDDFGSETLYLKVLYAGYEESFCIIEMIGEWNDLLYNDIMFLKRNVIEPVSLQGINRFILIGENVMNFHYAESDYYEEWYEENGDGWILCVNFRRHVIQEMMRGRLGRYLLFGGEFETIEWRRLDPHQFFHRASLLIQNRLNP